MLRIPNKDSIPNAPASGNINIYADFGGNIIRQLPDGSSKNLTSNIVKNNFTASTAPTVNDDSGDDYEVGSIWIDNFTSPATIYKCLDVTAGAAVWREVVLLNADGYLKSPQPWAIGSINIDNSTTTPAYATHSMGLTYGSDSITGWTLDGGEPGPNEFDDIASMGDTGVIVVDTSHATIPNGWGLSSAEYEGIYKIEYSFKLMVLNNDIDEHSFKLVLGTINEYAGGKDVFHYDLPLTTLNESQNVREGIYSWAGMDRYLLRGTTFLPWRYGQVLAVQGDSFEVGHNYPHQNYAKFTRIGDLA